MLRNRCAQINHGQVNRVLFRSILLSQSAIAQENSGGRLQRKGQE
jgi:hypothetical protein